MQPATSDKTFHLKWNNHLQNLSQLFTTIYSSSALADVTLSCRDGSIRAHKLVLSACSPYFEQIFKENPCKHPVIILKGIPYAEINLLVEFMYKGSVDVQELDLQSLMHTASELEIRGLAYEIRKDASSLLNVNLNEYPNFPTAPSIVQDSSFTAAFDTAAQACSSPYDSTPRNVNPYQTNLERLRQIHMYQQAMCRNTPYTTASTQAATDVSSIKRKRKNDEPMPATTTTAVKNILAAAAKELAEKQSSSNTTSIQTEEDVQIIDLKVEKEDEEEEAPLHSRDTRYKGKKRVSVGLQNDYAPVAPKNKSAPVNVEGIMPQGILKCVDLQNLRESRDNVTNTIEDNDDSSALDTSDDNHQPMETTYENVAEPDDEYDSSDSKQESSVNPKKVYKCDLCDLSFNRSSHLARHRRTHTGERPYRCEACGRCFARGDKLKLHMRICEKDEYVLPGQTAVVDESKNPVKKDVSQAMVPGMVSIGHSERHQLMFTPSGEVMLAPRVHGESREPIPEINTSINTEHPNQSMAEPSSLTPVSTSERLNYSDSGYPIKRGRGRPRKKPLPPVELPIVKKKRGRPPKIIKIDPMEPGRSMDNYTSSNLPYGDFSYLTDIISTHFNQSTQQAYQNMMQMNPMITANALTSALSSQGGLSTLVPAALQNLENFKNQVILKDKLHAAALAHQSTSQPESSVRNSSISSPPPMNIIHNADVNPQSSTKTKDMEKKENDKIAGMEMINTKINLNNCDEDKSDRATLEDLEKSTQKVVMIGDCQIVKLSDKYSSAAEASETKSNAASIGDCTIQPIPQNE